MAQFHLEPHCVLVTGARRAAIYDLNSGNVYSVNDVGTEILLGREENPEYWQQLVDLGLAYQGNRKPLLEIPHFKPQLSFMWLEVTSDCNLKCIHCYGKFGGCPKVADEQIDWANVLSQGAELGCRKVQFIGGEPFKYHGLLDLIFLAKELGYTFIEVFTNGTLLTRENAAFLKDCGARIAISLYSVNEEVHDGITQVRGSFGRTMAALDSLKEFGVETRVAVVLMRQNQETVDETCRFIHACGFRFKGADLVRPSGRGGDQGLIPDADLIRTHSLRTRPNFVTGLVVYSRAKVANSCWSGRMAITPSGDVIPCTFARNHVVGNIIQQPLGEIVEGESIRCLWATTLDSVEVCRDCEYRYACKDCRPLAEASSGNLFAKNPRCLYNPYEGVWEKDVSEKSA